jgi:outer membrane receptor protein involved in Fe transport
LNKERIDDYAVVDLNLRYTINDFWRLREAKVGLELSNLFDKKYVGAIIGSDTGTGAEYYAAPPFTAILTVSGKF